MHQDVLKAALAGLLHDVGKFAQRAGEQSQDFVRQYVPEQWRQELDAAKDIVPLADRLSAGKCKDEEQEQARQLFSIFSSLQADGRKAPENRNLCWPLKPLSLKRHIIFPVAESDPDYTDLWRGFEQAAQSLRDAHTDGDNLATYLESMLLLMQQYTWCIPSAYYRSVPDVSLYDHSRTTAALAACLTADDRSENWCSEVVGALKQGRDDCAASRPVCLLVGGDISGVQKFIYSIASENAAKSLRGRSFYLQLLTEAVVLYTLDQLQLPITNLLYAGGGNFYLLVPTGAASRLKEIQTQVTRRLFSTHEGDLRLALAWTPASAAEFRRGSFANAWDRLHQRLRRAKEHSLAELPADEMAEHIGQSAGAGGNERTCPVCGRDQAGLSDGQSCSLCASLEELGNQLAYATHLVIARRPAPETHRQHIAKWWHGLEQFGINVWAVNARKKRQEGHLPGSEGKSAIIYVYPLPQNQTRKPEQVFADALLREARAQGPVVTAFRPFAQLVPRTWPQDTKQERIATFDDLAEHSQGIKRWGVLRMDVDNLGHLFRDGFKRQQEGREVNGLTLSRLASLSFALSLFFEGYVATLGQLYQKYTTAPEPKPQAEKHGLYDKLYVQYAGGDDLFVVGAWDALPGFAADVQAEFAEYVCHNPNVTLSGGITLHPAKFPLYQAADQADQAEEAAKSFHRQVNGREVKKNAITFLGQTLSWDDLAEARRRKETILRWLEQGAPRAIIQQLRTLHQEWLNGQKEAEKEGRLKADQFYYGPWMWHAAYQLTRTARSSRDKKIETEIEAWEKELLREGNALIGLLGLAARWADYITRTRKGG